MYPIYSQLNFLAKDKEIDEQQLIYDDPLYSIIIIEPRIELYTKKLSSIIITIKIKDYYICIKLIDNNEAWKFCKQDEMLEGNA